MVHLLIAVLDALGIDSSNYILNRFSLNKQRTALRKAQSEKIMQKFSSNEQPLTIHWDSKLLTTLTEKNEDRLAIIATAPGLEQILDMPDIPSGTGLEMSSAVYDALEKQNILSRTEAFVFDTTSSNTGRFKGACVLLEKAIGRDILFLGCRHHIFEIILAAVYSEANVGVSTGPDIAIFKKFKKCWSKIDQQDFEPGISHPRIREIVGDDCEEILSYAFKKIEESYPRSDYKELLELIIIFLGGSPPRGIKFSKPGALHHARWMAKAIYSLKMVIFRNQLTDLTDAEVNGLLEVCGFIIKVYSVFWFDSHKPEKAALNDLRFLKKIVEYKAFNRNIADKAISKILNHLYYLNEECIGFAIFDDRIDAEIKTKMVKKMITGEFKSEDEDEEESIPKKLQLKKESLTNFISRDFSDILEELVSKNTIKIFLRFGISTDFLKLDPLSWHNLEEYKRGQNIVKNLSVVNDSAERGIKLIQEYHGKITHDEEQKQHLLKVIMVYLLFHHILLIFIYFKCCRWYKAIGNSFP